MSRTKEHEFTIKVRFNAPITKEKARKLAQIELKGYEEFYTYGGVVGESIIEYFKVTKVK